MTLPPPPQVDDAVINALVGSTSLSRGRTYARKGAVSSIEWYPKSLELKAKVQALKEKKASLFTAVLDDDAMFSAALSAEDVRGLFDG